MIPWPLRDDISVSSCVLTARWCMASDSAARRPSIVSIGASEAATKLGYQSLDLDVRRGDDHDHPFDSYDMDVYATSLTWLLYS